MKKTYECEVRDGRQLVGVLTAVNSTLSEAWDYFEKESRKLKGCVSNFKCLH